MIEKDFAGKLAAGMRRAKQPSTAETSVPAATTSSATVAAQPVTARRAGESLSVSTEDPWANLHPKRIWPD